MKYLNDNITSVVFTVWMQLPQKHVTSEPTTSWTGSGNVKIKAHEKGNVKLRPNSVWCCLSQWKAPGPAGHRGLSAPWAAAAVTTSEHAPAPALRRQTVGTSAWDSTQRRLCATLTPAMVRMLLLPVLFVCFFQCIYFLNSCHNRRPPGFSHHTSGWAGSHLRTAV